MKEKILMNNVVWNRERIWYKFLESFVFPSSFQINFIVWIANQNQPNKPSKFHSVVGYEDGM